MQKVKLKTSRATQSGANHRGDVIEVSDDEAKRMIKRDQAEPVGKPDKAETAAKPDAAAKRNAG